MSARDMAMKLKVWVVDLLGLLFELLVSLGRLLAGALRWLRPILQRLWSWAGPGVQASWLRLRSSTGRRLAQVWSGLMLVRRPIFLALLICALTLGIGRAFVRTTPVGKIAVRQVEWGDAGVIKKDEGPGLHSHFSLRDGWYLLRAGSHLITFAAEAEGGNHQPLEVATVEGESVQVSVLVPYRILPGRGWKLVADGLRADYPARAVAICRRVLLEELGTLTALEYADPDARTRVESSALERLNTELAASYLEAMDVRIGSTFFDSTYEMKMLEKQLAAQGGPTQEALLKRKEQERLNGQDVHKLQDSEAALIREYALQQEALRDAHDVRVAELSRQAKRYRAQALSDSAVEVLGLKDEGELALAAAEELRQTLFDQALRTTGGRLHVAREAAENLRFGTVTLNSSDPRVPNVLDLDEMVGLLLGKDTE